MGTWIPSSPIICATKRALAAPPNGIYIYIYCEREKERESERAGEREREREREACPTRQVRERACVRARVIESHSLGD